MIKFDENNYVICKDDDDKLMITKVRDVIFSGRAYTNSLLIGGYYVALVKDENGKIYTNASSDGNFYYSDGQEKIKICDCDQYGATILSESEIKTYLSRRLNENSEIIKKLTYENAVILSAKDKFNL